MGFVSSVAIVVLFLIVVVVVSRLVIRTCRNCNISRSIDENISLFFRMNVREMLLALSDKSKY